MEDDTVNVLIDFTQKVSFVRMMGNAFIPTQLTLKAEVLPHEEADELDFDVAFAKIRFWFETIVSRTVVLSRNNTQALKMFTDEDGKPTLLNNLMITPHEPTDEHLAALFQAKMFALSSGMMAFGAVRINSEAANGLVWSYIGDWSEDLPDMDHWFTTKPYYFTSPWWTRDDASTTDMITAGADVEKIPNWAMPLDFIEAAIRPSQMEEDSLPEPAGSIEDIVIRGTFRPTVIDTGTED